MKFRIKSIVLDQTGMTTSIACAVHCAAIPFLATYLPLWGMEFLANSAVEFCMLGLALCIGLFSLTTAYKNHQQKLPIIIMIVSFLIIAIGHFAENLESILVPIGGLLIALSHFMNIKSTRTCKSHQPAKDEN